MMSRTKLMIPVKVATVTARANLSARAQRDGALHTLYEGMYLCNLIQDLNHPIDIGPFETLDLLLDALKTAVCSANKRYQFPSRCNPVRSVQSPCAQRQCVPARGASHSLGRRFFFLSATSWAVVAGSGEPERCVVLTAASVGGCVASGMPKSSRSAVSVTQRVERR
jgi:hypothetical protein